MAGITDAATKILAYLDDQAKDGQANLQSLDKLSIAQATGLEPKLVDKAMTHLTDRGLAFSQSVRGTVYLPKSPNGVEVRRHWVRTGFIGVPVGWSFLLAGLLAVSLFSAWPLQAPEDVEGKSLDDAYRDGVFGGLALLPIIVVPISLIIHAGLHSLHRLHLLSPVWYEATLTIAKPAFVIFLGLQLGYVVGIMALEWPVDPSVELAILTASVGGAVIYRKTAETIRRARSTR